MPMRRCARAVAASLAATALLLGCTTPNEAPQEPEATGGTSNGSATPGEAPQDDGLPWDAVSAGAGDPPRIDVLFFGAPMDEPASFGTWDEVAEAMEGAAGDVGWLGAETTDGTCGPLAAGDPDTRHEVASVGKLYVLDLVGRDAVDAALADLGHREPAATQPLLTTREVFQLSWQVDDALRARYVDGGLDERRTVLDDLADLPLEVPLEDAVGWSASPAELCSVIVTLRERVAADPELAPVLHVLGQNPIVRLGDRWTASSGKGGSMPGVLAFAWDLERDDGRAFAFVVSFQEATAIDQTSAIPLVEGALELLADTPG